MVLAAERLGKEGTRSKKQDQNKAPKRVTNNKIDRFANLSNVTSKITWQNGLPESPREPPESSRGPPGRPKTVPKSALSAPGRAQEPLRALRELPRNGFGAVLAASWTAQRLRRGHFDLPGARFWTLRRSIFEVSGASSGTFRGALSIAFVP